MRPDTYEKDQEAQQSEETHDETSSAEAAAERDVPPGEDTPEFTEATSEPDVRPAEPVSEEVPPGEYPPEETPEPEVRSAEYSEEEVPSGEYTPEPVEYTSEHAVSTAEDTPDDRLTEEPSARGEAVPVTDAAPTAYAPPVAEAGPSTDAPTAVGVAPVEGARWPHDTGSEFEQRWQQVLLQFVDDPSAATQAAQALVTEAVDQHTAALTVHKRELDGWSESGDDDTERLRTAVRGYRALLDRLLGS